jgi:FkbM family methyltransferase
MKYLFSDNENLNNLFEQVITNIKKQDPNDATFKIYKEYTILKFKELLEKNNYCVELFSKKIKIVKTSFGKVNLQHLFNLDELIIFNFYYINRKRFKNVCDIGANIGLHSIFLEKFGYKVDAYEPDPVHRKIAKTNFIINKSKILLKEEAVGNFEGKIQFTRIKNNTTASFIGNHKKTKGKTKKFFVKVIDSKSLKNKYDLIKIDAEGSEVDILKRFDKKSFNKTTFVIEISTKKNQIVIWNMIKDMKLNVYSQKIKWQKVKKLKDLPHSHLQGSIIISKKSPF